MSASTPELQSSEQEGEDGSSGAGEGGAPTGPDRGRRGLDRRMALPLIVIVVIAGGFALLFQHTSHNSQPLAGNASSAKSASFLGNELSPPKQAPSLALRNYLGAHVNIAQYHGKALLVTFLYTHCPDVCPLITANLRVAQNLMGAKTAAKTQIIAVSVDPRGDTPRTVAAFLKVHEMTGRMQYLIGSPKELGHTWQTWGVGSEKDASQPEFINHSALVYGITASGVLKTVYIGSSFKPSEIAHDAPLLASQ
jgi:protein SCO1/2